MRRLSGAALVGAPVLVLSLVLPPTSVGAAAGSSGEWQVRQSTSLATPAAGWRTRMLARVNAVRSLAGAAPVVYCPSLQASAQAYASQLARSNTFGHIGPDGRGPGERMTAAGYRWTLAGENLAGGQRTVYEVMQGWRGSASHLATMSEAGFTHVGFGYATAAVSTYGRYWVQHYAAGRC